VVPSHGEWAGTMLNIYVAAYNTQLVKKEDLPQRYEDLQDPKWQGRLGIERDNHAWFGTLIAAMGEQRGRETFDRIVAANGMSPRKGHMLLANMVASGEVPLALTMYSWIVPLLQKKGAPIEAHPITPVVAMIDCAAVLSNAPNPASALLFYDFILSAQGQKIMLDMDFPPVHQDLPHPLRDRDLVFIDPAKTLYLSESWRAAFENTIIKKAKQGG
jgi:iron(III) transport system substrate-binding protein